MKQYNITGMTCAACSARVEKAVSSVQGVDYCSVNLLTNSMTVEGSATEGEIISAVVNAGYGAAAEKGTGEKEDAFKDTETPKLKKRLISSLGFLSVLMYFSMGHAMWGFPLPSFFEKNPLYVGLVQLLLTLHMERAGNMRHAVFLYPGIDAHQLHVHFRQFVDDGPEIMIDGIHENVEYIPLCGDCYLEKVEYNRILAYKNKKM